MFFLSFILFTHDNLIILQIFLLCILAIKQYIYIQIKIKKNKNQW